MADDFNVPEEIILPQYPPGKGPQKVPDFIEAKASEIVNPIQLAFRKALLPILMTNTKSVRDLLRPATGGMDPRMMTFIAAARIWPGSDPSASGVKTFAALVDLLLPDKPIGTGIKLMQKVTAAHHFMPLSVIIPMRDFQNHTYVPRMPYIVYRAESQNVYCVDTDGMSTSALPVIGAKCMAASDEEVFACVDGLTATEIAAMMVHEYFRPVLHNAMGIGADDSDDEETDQGPQF